MEITLLGLLLEGCSAIGFLCCYIKLQAPGVCVPFHGEWAYAPKISLVLRHACQILGCSDKADDSKVISLAIILDFDVLLVAWGPQGVTDWPRIWSINYSWLNIRLHHPEGAWKLRVFKVLLLEFCIRVFELAT